jgi:hypothetical protein
MKKIARPSPAMVVSLIALVFAMTGSAAAVVVNFARNAGAVDGRSATSSSASPGFAAGKLVAVRQAGALRGTLPSKFLDPNTVPRQFVFGRNAEVIDNGQETPFTIATIAGFGNVTATCGDENNAVGKENPKTTITFGNTSGQTIEFARATGSGSVAVANLANNQASSFTITSSNTFTLQAQKLGTNLLIQGVVRQNTLDPANASCINYGSVSQLG